MLEIQSLTERAQQLTRAVDWWNTATVWALVAAAITAIAIVVTTRMTLNRAKELADIQAKLLQMKDSQIASDLRAKELKIAEANQTASEANERAGKFATEAAELNAENLRLEEAIDPRRLTRRQQEALSSLSAFSGRFVNIKSYSSDTEGLILATQILDAFKKSRLRIEDNRLTMQPAGSISFGVSVEGPDTDLVGDLRRILSMDGSLLSTSTITSPVGNAVHISFGEVIGPPPAATIIVGVKPVE